jgi:hypothetical protein
MIYQTTSIKEVIARVVRNTRLQDSSFLVDMAEWIPEAMGYMKTRVQTRKVYKDVCVRFYKTAIPCKLQSVLAVTYGGCRLKYYSGDQSFDSFLATSNSSSVYPGIPERGDTTFGTHLVKRAATDDGVDVEFTETDLQRVSDLPFHGEHWYYIEPGFVVVSLKDGAVRLHGKTIPLDKGGLPLIPDNENYKEAIYWYVRERMAGAGYPEKVYSTESMRQRFEEHAYRAMSQITYPSTDQVEQQVENLYKILEFPTDRGFWDTYYSTINESPYSNR